MVFVICLGEHCKLFFPIWVLTVFLNKEYIDYWLGISYIGEYAERIDNADELLESFLDNFNDENSQVSVSQNIKGTGSWDRIQFFE